MLALAAFAWVPYDGDGITPATGRALEVRSVFKSNGGGVKNGIPIYGLGADGLFMGPDQGGVLDPLRARVAPLKREQGYSYLIKLYIEGKYLEFYKSFGLEGENLLWFLRCRTNT
jgi:hypothetical protein